MNSIRTLRPTRVMIAAGVAIAAVIAVLLTGFLGGRRDDSAQFNTATPASASGGASTQSLAGGSSDEAGLAKDQPASADRSGNPVAGSAAAPPGSPGAPASGGAAGAQRVRTANIDVQVDDVGAAAAKVRATALRLGGSVASEDSQSPSYGGYAQDVLVVRVPEPKLEEAVDAVAATGKELSRTSSSEDVTAVLADLESREASQRASVERIRALMAKAASLRDVVLLESELSRRQSDLEAAQASRRAMSDQAAQAALTVSLSTARTAAVPEDPNQENAFVAGLRRSWDTVLASTTVLLTVLGALLPIAVLLLVVGGPAYLLARRDRRARVAPVSSAPPPVNPGPGPSDTGAPDAGKSPVGSAQ